VVIRIAPDEQRSEAVSSYLIAVYLGNSVPQPRVAAADLIGEPLAKLACRCRTVSWLTMMPRAASNSSTMRSPSGKRK
jgi:hypothetical protein